MARIVRQRKLYQANFGLKEYKNWAEATAAADKWIRSLLKNLPPPLKRRDRPTANNRSGVVGVYLNRVARVRGSRKVVYRSWVAWWPDSKVRGGIKWSVKKFGDDDAFVLAVLCRRLETHDRARVLEEFKNIRPGAEYERILEQRKGKRPRKSAQFVAPSVAEPPPASEPVEPAGTEPV